MKNYFPEPGLQKHMIITIRNPNAARIPAEGIEVPLLEPDDTINLLSTLLTIAITLNSLEREYANKIIQKLGNLLLAIEQVGIYIREAAGNFVTFLDDYDKSSRDLHKWVSQGNRQYPHSVVTTWFLSFNIIRENHPQATQLFQLLLFLNLDSIVIDFL